MNDSGILEAIFNSSHEKRWWKREFVAEYMPIVSKNDASLVKLLRRYGLIRVNSTKPDQHVGWLHHVIQATRVISVFNRTEFLIYAKFGILVVILLIQFWWNAYGIRQSQSYRKKVEERLKRLLDVVNSRISKVPDENRKIQPN